MAYHPRRHDRKPPRLRGFDYTSPAAYFVTLCTYDRACIFGDVVDGVVRLNALGRLVKEEWLRSEVMREEVVLDAYVVMPNHVHGIVVIVPPGTDMHGARDPRGYHVDPFGTAHRAVVGATRRSPLPTGPPPHSIGAIIAGFKSAATCRINRMHGTLGIPVWQRGYHDRISRDERGWRNVRQYIAMNPARWHGDRHHPDGPRRR